MIRTLSAGDLPIPVSPERAGTPISNVIIIGAGGTGGHLFHNVLRLIKDTQIKITLVDGDIVERKNVNRQNFFESDIGKKKAAVQANRYGRACGVPVDIVDEFLEDETLLLDLLRSSASRSVPVVLSCVDNHKTRKLIGKVASNSRFFWIDSGNHEWSGQVVCGFNGRHRIEVPTKGSPYKLFHLPNILDVHPEISRSEDLFKSEISCAEMAQTNLQNIATNIMSATCQFTMLNQLLTGEGLTSHILRFDAKSGAVSSSPTSPSALARYYEDDKTSSVV